MASLGILHSHADDKLLDAMGRMQAASVGMVPYDDVVVVGSSIPVETSASFVRGHGTYKHEAEDTKLSATICGVLERVDKLIAVRSLRGRYTPQSGDVVVGRGTQVVQKRWKVDINAPQDAHLMLSAVSLPGDIQRRRTGEDELHMREMLEEADVLSAEVQNVHVDHSLLHTRSQKYGKLAGGMLVKVAPYLVKRLSQHFHTLSGCGSGGVRLVIGCNGYIWVHAPLPPLHPSSSTNATTLADVMVTGDAPADDTHEPVPLRDREEICRCAASIRVLGRLSLPVHPAAISSVFSLSLETKCPVKSMLAPEFLISVIETEISLRDRQQQGLQ
eukprot:TRINITY_DN705_c0_g2_i1.p1 TRINITY_DN705_c0_g2~~TRINITY_DN705_c0_g2_i1.p1  ORF type:complete len:331 (-),score=51.67 TRINITY_DN705_c0_g2_i1:88-1080(-)